MNKKLYKIWYYAAVLKFVNMLHCSFCSKFAIHSIFGIHLLIPSWFKYDQSSEILANYLTLYNQVCLMSKHEEKNQSDHENEIFDGIFRLNGC